jgi:hypothetical protein
MFVTRERSRIEHDTSRQGHAAVWLKYWPVRLGPVVASSVATADLFRPEPAGPLEHNHGWYCSSWGLSVSAWTLGDHVRC